MVYIPIGKHHRVSTVFESKTRAFSSEQQCACSLFSPSAMYEGIHTALVTQLEATRLHLSIHCNVFRKKKEVPFP